MKPVFVLKMSNGHNVVESQPPKLVAAHVRKFTLLGDPTPRQEQVPECIHYKYAGFYTRVSGIAIPFDDGTTPLVMNDPDGKAYKKMAARHNKAAEKMKREREEFLAAAVLRSRLVTTEDCTNF